MCFGAMGVVFFFNASATTEIYTLSLPDAIPICANPEYLENTVAHLDELGINDGPLHELLALLRGGKSLNQAHFE